MMASKPDRAGRTPTTERRIVEAARRLFLTRGLAGVNMDAIASEAGVARQTLYNRFGSKEAVFRAAIDAHWQTLAQAAAAHLDPARPPQDVLTDVADDVLAFVRDSDQVAMTRMVIAESRETPDLARLFYARGKAPLLARFIDYLAAATRQGLLECPDPDLAARQYLGMIQESLLWPQVMGVASVPDADTVVHGAVFVFLRAYAPGTHAQRPGRADERHPRCSRTIATDRPS